MKLLHIIFIGINGGNNILQKYTNYYLTFRKLGIDYRLLVIAPIGSSYFSKEKYIEIHTFKYLKEKYLLRRLWFNSEKLIIKKINTFNPTFTILRIDQVNSTINRLVKKFKLILDYPNAPIEKSLYQKPFYHKLAIKYNKQILEQSLLNIVTVKETEYKNSFVLPNSLINEQYYKKMDFKIIGSSISILFLSSKYGSYEYNGYDRFLSGLSNFMKVDNNFTFKLYFAGGDKSDILKLINQYNLENLEINYLGFKSIEELNNLIPNINLGINDIGYHRQNIKFNSTLKTVDFLGWNLPFIISHLDINLNIKDQFYLKIDENENDINMDKVISFLKSFDQVKIKQMKLKSEEISLEKRLKSLLYYLEKRYV